MRPDDIAMLITEDPDILSEFVGPGAAAAAQTPTAPATPAAAQSQLGARGMDVAPKARLSPRQQQVLRILHFMGGNYKPVAKALLSGQPDPSGAALQQAFMARAQKAGLQKPEILWKAIAPGIMQWARYFTRSTSGLDVSGLD